MTPKLPFIPVTRRWFDWVVLALIREPSWIAEFASGVGTLWWGICAFLTDNFVLTPEDYVLPSLALLMGPLRVGLLAKAPNDWRALAAGASFIGWGWVAIGLWEQQGASPASGAYLVPVVCDVFTMLKFSALHYYGRTR